MRTIFTILIFIFLSAYSATSQSIEELPLIKRTHSLQTNLMSFLRYQSAINLQYQYRDLESRTGWVFSLDIPFYLIKEPESHTHRYQSNIVFPTFDVKLMYTKNFGTTSDAYVGIGFDYGFNQYKHRHIVCLSSELVNGTCICNRYDSNTFYSEKHRAGMTLRFAIPLRFSPKFIGYLAFQSSFSYIFQPRLRDRLYHNQCGEIENFRPKKSNIEIFTFNAPNPDFTGAQGQFHVELILPIKTFYHQ